MDVFSRQRVHSVSSLSQMSFKIAEISCTCGKEENAAIMSPDVDISTVTFIFTWQACFPAPGRRIRVRRYRCDEVTGVICGLAMWGKAVCMRASPGEFTRACTTLFASSDTVAFPADKTMKADSQRAFCSIQLLQKKARILAKTLKQSRSRVQLDLGFFFLKGNTVFVLKSEHKNKTALPHSVLHR